jgi:fructose-1,6-bisphosphatase/inositol monophosphatase family enzyme
LDDEIRDLMRFAAQRSMLPRFRNLTAGEVEMKGADDPVTIVDRVRKRCMPTRRC